MAAPQRRYHCALQHGSSLSFGDRDIYHDHQYLTAGHDDGIFELQLKKRARVPQRHYDDAEKEDETSRRRDSSTTEGRGFTRNMHGVVDLLLRQGIV